MYKIQFVIFKHWDRKLNLCDHRRKASVPCYLVPVLIVVLESSMEDNLYLAFGLLSYHL